MLNLLGINRKDGGQTSCKEHSGKGYDEGLDVKVAYKETLDSSECKSDTKRQQYRNKYVSALIQVQYTAHYHKGCHRTNAYIDTGGDHYYGQTAGYDYQAGIVVQHIEYLLYMKEAALQYQYR